MADVSGTSGRAEQAQFPGMPTPLYAASASRLLAWLDCPRRYRFHYLDRPRPAPRPQRAHTSIGVAVHNALRDWWDGSDRRPQAGARLVEAGWIEVGFRDPIQSQAWLERTRAEVTAYLQGVDPTRPPLGVERIAAFKTDTDLCARWAMFRFAARAAGPDALPVMADMAADDPRFAADYQMFAQIYQSGVVDFERVWLLLPDQDPHDCLHRPD